MCGIVGYIGDQQAAPILLAGLAKLEYRGYDSAGISVRNETNGEIEVVKAKGRLKTLIEKTDEGHSVYGSCGIGHTRWATHGEPSETNAHPHCSEGKNVGIGSHRDARLYRGAACSDPVAGAADMLVLLRAVRRAAELSGVPEMNRTFCAGLLGCCKLGFQLLDLFLCFEGFRFPVD